ncbi:MAG: dual specificity protein phosphatase family protein [Tepidisphaerales bacterium]
MAYAVALVIFAGFLGVSAWRGSGWMWLLAWPMLSCLVMAGGYLGLGARVTGKRPDGRFPLWSILVCGPYLLYYNCLAPLGRWIRRDRLLDRIVPGLWLGRIPARGGLPPEIQWVVDVVCEMPRAAGVVDDAHYIAFPMLDGSILPVDEFRAAVRRTAALDGEVLIHCAAGRGRSATLMAGVLLARGLADSPERAVDMLRAARPGIRINRSQMRVLAAACS